MRQVIALLDQDVLHAMSNDDPIWMMSVRSVESDRGGWLVGGGGRLVRSRDVIQQHGQIDTETHRNKDTRTHRHRDSEKQRHTDPQTHRQRHRDTQT